MKPSAFDACVRRWLSRTCLLACALVLAAPVLLGPAFPTILRILHAEAVHLCMCGMPAGKCGCPECERLEQLRHHKSPPSHEAALTSNCNDDEAPVASTIQSPYALPAGVLLRKSAPEGTLSVRAIVTWHGFEGDGPPTPPPRLRCS